jgi:hypothetical protein
MQKLEINTHASSIKSAKPRRDWDSVEPLRTSREVWKRHCTAVTSACTPRLHSPPCRRQHRFHRQPPARSATSTAPVPSKTTAPMKRGMEKARSAHSPVATEAARGGGCDGGGGDGVSRARRERWKQRREEGASARPTCRRVGERLVVLPAEPAEAEPRGWQHCPYRFFRSTRLGPVRCNELKS